MNSAFIGKGSFHIASFAIFFIFALLLLTKGKEFGAEVIECPLFYLASVVLLGGFAAVTLFSEADTSNVVFVNQIIAPFFLFLIVRIVLRSDPARYRFLIKVFLILALVEALISIAQYVTKDFGIYTQFFETEVWWSGKYYRSVGTMNHFLTLGLVCASAVPLANVIRNAVLRTIVAFVLVVGVAYSQSRLALIVAGIGLGYVLVVGRRSPWGRLIGVAVGASVVFAAFRLEILAPVIGRFEEDSGSNALRAQAYAWFWNHWSEFLLSFEGMGHSFAVSVGAGLATSFESAFIMYAIDFGIVAAGVYFAGLLGLIFFSDRPIFVRLSALAALILPMTFSSLAIDSAAGVVVWYLVAVGAGSAIFRANGKFWRYSVPVAWEVGSVSSEFDEAKQAKGRKTR